MATVATVIAKLAAALADAQSVAPPPAAVVSKLQAALAEANAVSAPSITIHKFPLALAGKTVSFREQWDGGSYSRLQHHVCLTTAAFTLELSSRETSPNFLYPKYGLLFADPDAPLGSGVELGTYTALRPERNGKAVGNVGTLASGPYRVDIVAYDAAGMRVTNPTECLIPFCVWVDLDGTAKDHPCVIFQNGNFDWLHNGSDGPVYLWAKVPKTLVKTRSEPLDWWNIPSLDTSINQSVPGVFPGGEPFSTPILPTGITRLLFAPAADNNNGSLRRPAFTTRGIMVTENVAGYSGSHFHAKSPRQPMLDGNRGEATVSQATAMWMGHAGSVYYCDTFGFRRVNPKGKQVTFAGIRHKRAPYWEEMGAGADPSTWLEAEIRGDWDPSIQINRRYPWECWGMYADTRQPIHDFTLPPINLPPFGNLPQHAGEGPTFQLNCRFGRNLKAQFHKLRPADPPTMTEFITGLSDPWGLANDGVGVMFIAERTAHRISKWNMDTGAFLGVLIGNPNGNNFGAMDDVTWRRWQGGSTTLAQRRAQSILAPEGLAYQDGYVYWGSYAQADVRRINVATGAVELVTQVPISSEQSRFVALALSDGTFGPRGTVFTTTFATTGVTNRPRAWLPTPGLAAGISVTHSVQWGWTSEAGDVLRGAGGRTVATVYALGIAVGNGMLAHGGSGHGLDVFVKTMPGEPLPDYARATRGHTWYRAQGYGLIHGNYGWGHCAGVPLPWGENADCDYWLKLSGHTPPA